MGTSVGSIWGLKSLGLYQTQAEIDAAPLPISETPRLGDIRYLDYNGDGLISWDDEVKIARPTTPEMMFSLMADANWKGFDLSVQLQGAASVSYTHLDVYKRQLLVSVILQFVVIFLSSVCSLCLNIL